MSQANVDRLQKAIEAFNRRDRAAWLAFADPDLENIPPQEWPESEPIRGREAVWDFYVEAFEPWENGRIGHDEIIDGPNGNTLVEIRGELQGKASGAGVWWSFWQVTTFRDEKAIRISWFHDRADALEAAGLSE